MKLQLTHKSSNANLCRQYLMHNDYIALIAFFCDVKCFKKKSQSWMGFELITVRYSGIVLTYLGFRKSVHRPLMSKE